MRTYIHPFLQIILLLNAYSAALRRPQTVSNDLSFPSVKYLFYYQDPSMMQASGDNLVNLCK